MDVIGNDPDLAVTNSGNTMSVASSRHRLSSETAHIVILEQPASKAMRFRYECEGRSAGSIPGVNSTPENKTFPTIQVTSFLLLLLCKLSEKCSVNLFTEFDF